MGTGKTQCVGGTVVSMGAHNMKTEGPGTDKARVLVANVMVNTSLLAMEAPATREARTLMQYFFCVNLPRFSNLAILALLFFPFALGDNTAAHPGVIAAATPAVQFNLLLELCTFLVLSHGTADVAEW
jgi:hypothetical protein